MRSYSLLGLLLASMVLGACSKEEELSKSDQATLQNNLSRALTPEEVAKMGAAPDTKKGSE